MSNEELIAYLKSLDLKVETLDALGGGRFVVIRDHLIPVGRLQRDSRDVAVMWSTQVPYVMHSSVHVRPSVVPMGSGNSQASPLGSDWQYLSRVLRGQPTPQRILAHINTVLAEVE